MVQQNDKNFTEHRNKHDIYSMRLKYKTQIKTTRAFGYYSYKLMHKIKGTTPK